MDLPAEVDHSIHAMDNETAASNNQITFPFAFPRTGIAQYIPRAFCKPVSRTKYNFSHKKITRITCNN